MAFQRLKLENETRVPNLDHGCPFLAYVRGRHDARRDPEISGFGSPDPRVPERLASGGAGQGRGSVSIGGGHLAGRDISRCGPGSVPRRRQGGSLSARLEGRRRGTKLGVSKQLRPSAVVVGERAGAMQAGEHGMDEQGSPRRVQGHRRRRRGRQMQRIGVLVVVVDEGCELIDRAKMAARRRSKRRGVVQALWAGVLQ